MAKYNYNYEMVRKDEEDAAHFKELREFIIEVSETLKNETLEEEEISDYRHQSVNMVVNYFMDKAEVNLHYLDEDSADQVLEEIISYAVKVTQKTRQLYLINCGKHKRKIFDFAQKFLEKNWSKAEHRIHRRGDEKRTVDEYCQYHPAAKENDGVITVNLKPYFNDQ